MDYKIIGLTGVLLQKGEIFIEIKEDNSQVIIDDFEFYGQIEQEKYCSTCKFNLL
ncbi:MAG: hypothetical protein ABWX58_03270 [Psychrobacillus psychrotolerans]